MNHRGPQKPVLMRADKNGGGEGGACHASDKSAAILIL
jgi:hypothetical protein